MSFASSEGWYCLNPVNSNPLPLKTDLYSPVVSPKSPFRDVASSLLIIGRKSTFSSFILRYRYFLQNFLYDLVRRYSLALPFVINNNPMPQDISRYFLDIVWRDKCFSLN